MKMTIETRAARWFLWAFVIALSAGICRAARLWPGA